MSDRALHFQTSEALPFVEMRRANHSNACFHTHTHDEFSFGVIDQGQAIYTNQGTGYAIGQGHTVTINPGDAHACNPDAGVWSYRMLFVDTGWIGAMQQEVDESKVIDFHAFSQHFRDDSRSFSEFNRLYSSLQSSENGLQSETLLMEFLLELIPETAKKASNATLAKNQMSHVRDLLLDDVAENRSLSNIAEAVGVSRYHLVRSFKQHYGQAPHAYLLDHRIKRAKEKLQQGKKLSEVATDLGFSDQAHFQRHFKRRLAVTPKQYQAFFR